MDISLCLDTARSWTDLVGLARAAEGSGLHALYVPDHFGGFREAWTVLTGLAGATEGIRLGTLVLGVTHRPSKVVGEMARTLDEVSHGRLILGLGAGWNEVEHVSLGLAFPKVGQRLNLLETCCQDARLRTNATLLVGGGGERRTMAIAARHADVWHTWAEPEEFARKCGVLDAHCGMVERSPAEVRRASGDLLAGAEDPVGLLSAYEAAGTDEFIVRDHRDLPVADVAAALPRG
jgi:alkanesulfonate monooxygenase SsuD/methylene tetrahydromethanopterin reductase-like flavin-dependent oxidoreductase (luciferase family)